MCHCHVTRPDTSGWEELFNNVRRAPMFEESERCLANTAFDRSERTI